MNTFDELVALLGQEKARQALAVWETRNDLKIPDPVPNPDPINCDFWLVLPRGHWHYDPWGRSKCSADECHTIYIKDGVIAGVGYHTFRVDWRPQINEDAIHISWRLLQMVSAEKFVAEHPAYAAG